MPTSIIMQTQTYAGETRTLPLDPDAVSFEGVQTLNIGSQSTGAGAGKVAFQPLSITRKYDVTSPPYWGMLCSGTPFKTLTLSFSRQPEANPKPTPYLNIVFSLVAVKTIEFDLMNSDDVPREIVTFEYGGIVFSYFAQNNDGSVTAIPPVGWDRVRNVAMNDPTKVAGS